MQETEPWLIRLSLCTSFLHWKLGSCRHLQTSADSVECVWISLDSEDWHAKSLWSFQQALQQITKSVGFERRIAMWVVISLKQHLSGCGRLFDDSQYKRKSHTWCRYDQIWNKSNSKILLTTWCEDYLQAQHPSEMPWRLVPWSRASEDDSTCYVKRRVGFHVLIGDLKSYGVCNWALVTVVTRLAIFIPGSGSAFTGDSQRCCSPRCWSIP